jgi:hypothetical protein
MKRTSTLYHQEKNFMKKPILWEVVIMEIDEFYIYLQQTIHFLSGNYVFGIFPS